MREFEIVPHVGVGPVRLGMTQAEIHESLGVPDRPMVDGRERFLGGLFVDFDSEGRVEFIELAPSPEYRGVFQGVCGPVSSALQCTDR